MQTSAAIGACRNLALVSAAMGPWPLDSRGPPGRVAEQIHGQNQLELIWTVVPTLMVISFTVLSWNRLNFINDVNTNVAMTVKAEGRQWAWGFTYPDQAMFKLPDGTLLQSGEQLDIPV